MTIDRHIVALISIVGSSLDVLGALYLAYDLLGGEHGPLRTLTRAVTYGALFGTGFALALGPVFGLAAGLTHGITLGWELARVARRAPRSGFWQDTLMCAIRGGGFALGAGYLYGAPFGLTFGALSTAGQVVAYQLGIRPTLDYKSDARPRITKRQFLAGVNRTAGYTATGYVSSLVAHQREHAISVGLTAGLAIGVVTVVTTAFVPYIEWMADRIPERRMGVFGIALMLIGFALQSTQYWLALLDVKVQ